MLFDTGRKRHALSLAAAALVTAVLGPSCSRRDPQTADAEGAVERFRRGNPYTSRPLANMDRLFAPHRVVDILASSDRPRTEIRVLEFGMGEGRVLLDLRRRFPDIELHGINKGAWRLGGAEANAAWLRESAVFFGLFTAAEAAAMPLPHVHFVDVSDGRLGFLPTAYFDLVISQVSFGYVPRKDRLIEEFWRVLRPGGIALTDLDNLLLMSSGNALGLEDFFSRVAAEGPDVAVHRNGPFPYLIMRRNLDRPLALRLEPRTFDGPIFVDPRGHATK